MVHFIAALSAGLIQFLKIYDNVVDEMKTVQCRSNRLMDDVHEGLKEAPSTVNLHRKRVDIRLLSCQLNLYFGSTSDILSSRTLKSLKLTSRYYKYCTNG